MSRDLAKKKIRPRRAQPFDLYLGVDGGGTKTRAVLIDEDGNPIGEATAGASNPLRVGIEPAVENVLMAVEAACDAARRHRGDIAAAQIGLAGVRREDLRKAIRTKIIHRLGVRNVSVTTDAEIALYGASGGKAGLVLIAGTGSICCGRNAKGEMATAGGWGPLAGDEGGGAGIARRALQAIAKASDGRARPTRLAESAAEYFRVAKPADLVVAIYAPGVDNQQIAGFARAVIETARGGDAVALEIVAEAGRELGLAAKAVVEKLRMRRQKFPVAFVGSVFLAGEIIREPILKIIRAVAPKAYLSEPNLQPAVAAAFMARVEGRKNRGNTGKRKFERGLLPAPENKSFD